VASVPTDQHVTALVLGVGGNVSQGILKALELSDLRLRVVGACVSHLSAGLYTTDRAYVSPAAADPDFPQWLFDVCERERVDVVLSGVEPVLSGLSEHAGALRERTGAVALVSASDQLEVGQDKLLTAHWLAERGFPAPRTADAGDDAAVGDLVSTCGLPLVAKPRHGKGAVGVIEVATDADLGYVRRRPGYVLQERLGEAAEEYTVASLSDDQGQVRGAFALRRELQDGTTYRAEAGEFPDVRGEAIRIAEALRPTGPCNVQLRVADGRPVCFEINVRFSGTAPIRARLGFNDVEAAVRHYALGERAADLPVVRGGLALRYWNELYVDPAATELLQRTGRLDDPRAHPLVVEDYGVRAAASRPGASGSPSSTSP
jgi:carbamoyl-phosphate synthase large subunit